VTRSSPTITWRNTQPPSNQGRRFSVESIEKALDGDHPFALNRRDRRAIEAHKRRTVREETQ